MLSAFEEVMAIRNRLAIFRQELAAESPMSSVVPVGRSGSSFSSSNPLADIFEDSAERYLNKFILPEGRILRRT
jgi:hypothetical protein